MSEQLVAGLIISAVVLILVFALGFLAGALVS